MSEKVFTDTNILLLIHLVWESRGLYNKNLKVYRDKIVIDKLWDKIGKNCDNIY